MARTRSPYYKNWEGSGAQDTYEREKIKNLAKIQESETTQQIRMQDAASKRAEDVKNRALQLAIPEGAEANPQFMAAYSSFMNAGRNAPADAMEIRKSAIQAGLAAMSSNALQRDETAYAQKQNMIPDPQQLRRAAALGSEQGLERGSLSNKQNEMVTDYMGSPGKMDLMYGGATTPGQGVATSPVTGSATTVAPKGTGIYSNSLGQANVVASPQQQEAALSTTVNSNAYTTPIPPGFNESTGLGELRSRIKNALTPRPYALDPNNPYEEAVVSLTASPIKAPVTTQVAAPIATPVAPVLPDFGIPEKFTNEDLVNPKIREALLKRNEYRRKNGIPSSYQPPTAIASPQFSSSEYSPYRTEQNGDITRSYYR